jgi:hypothetical protein
MRHLTAASVLLACALLCSCAATRRAAEGSEDSEALEAFLDSGPAGLICDDTRIVGATSFSSTCLPPEEGVHLSATGLQSLSEPLRQCVLSRLPVETGPVDPSACQRGAAQVLQGRLRQLGWLDATVAPQQDAAAPRQAHLDVRLGVRYQVGPLHVEQDENARISPERILVKARAAAPEGSWYTTSVLAEMHARVFQMKKFHAVWIVGGEPDPESQVVPVTIDVWEKTSNSPSKKNEPKKSEPKVSKKKPGHDCPKRGAICLNGRDCVFDRYLGCNVCVCRPVRW